MAIRLINQRYANGKLKNFFNTTDAGISSFKDLYSIEFNGIDQRVNCGDDISLYITNKISLSAWFKTEDVTSGQRYLCGKYENPLADNKELGYCLVNDGNKIEFWVGRQESGPKKANGTTVLSASTWYHAVGTYDATTGIGQIYLNSVLDGSGSWSIAPIVSSSNGFYIGCYLNDNIEEDFFNGKIDEISLYNDVLSLSEIQEIWNSGKPLNLAKLDSYSKCVSWWRMGDTDSIPNVLDSKGDNDGTAVNMSSANIKTDVP